MESRRAHGTWLVVLSFVLAFVLSVFPFSASGSWLLPKWGALMVIFWALTLPFRVGIGTAFGVGLFLDLLEGNLLGQNALALSVVAYFVLLMQHRIRLYELWRQACIVFVLLSIYQLLSYWVLGIRGVVLDNMHFLYPALVSALCWPLFAYFMERLVIIFRVR